MVRTNISCSVIVSSAGPLAPLSHTASAMFSARMLLVTVCRVKTSLQVGQRRTSALALQLPQRAWPRLH